MLAQKNLIKFYLSSKDTQNTFNLLGKGVEALKEKTNALVHKSTYLGDSCPQFLVYGYENTYEFTMHLNTDSSPIADIFNMAVNQQTLDSCLRYLVQVDLLSEQSYMANCYKAQKMLVTVVIDSFYNSSEPLVKLSGQFVQNGQAQQGYFNIQTKQFICE